MDNVKYVCCVSLYARAPENDFSAKCWHTWHTHGEKGFVLARMLARMLAQKSDASVRITFLSDGFPAVGACPAPVKER